MFTYKWARHLFPPQIIGPPDYATGIIDDVSQPFATYIDDIFSGVRTIVNPNTFTEGDVYTWRFRGSNSLGNIRYFDIEWRYIHSSTGSANLESRSINRLNVPGPWVPQLQFLNGPGAVFAFDSLMQPQSIKSTITAPQVLENGVFGKASIVFEQTLNGTTQTGGITVTPLTDSGGTIVGYDHTASSVALGNGGYDIRGLAINNLRVEEPAFNPQEGPARVKGDILALPISTSNFPSGWSPSSDVFSILNIHSGDGLLFHLLSLETSSPQPEPGIFETLSGQFPVASFPSVPGKVADLDIEWDGSLSVSGEEIPLIGLAGIYGDCAAVNEENDLVVQARKKPAFALLHSCSEKSGCKSFSCPTGLPDQNGEGQISYNSCQSGRGTASFGYGWNSSASERILEDSNGNLSYKTSGGGYLRWSFDGTDYLPTFPGNYTEAEKDAASTNARYKLTFKDQSVLEFNDLGRIKRSLDRNGNQMVYSYNSSSGHLETIDDLRGRTLHYDYGTRTDGQPMSVRANNPTTGRQTQFNYFSSSDPDVPDRLKEIIDPEGNVTQFTYSTLGRLSTVTDSSERVSNRFFYDGLGRIVREVQFDEVEMLYNYGNQQATGLDFMEVRTRDLSTVDPEPDRYSFTLYDPFGNAIQTAELVDDSGPQPLFNVTEMAYNDPNNPFLLTGRLDPNLTTVFYEYDIRGNVTKMIDKDSNETVYTYADTLDPAPINPKHRNLVRTVKRPDVTVDGTVVSYPKKRR